MEETNTATVEEANMHSLVQLIKTMQSIIAIEQSLSKTKTASPMIGMIKKYERLIGSGKSNYEDHHAPLFVDLYRDHRVHFLDIWENPQFIGEQKLRVWFGEDNKEARKKNIRLPIGICHEKAFEMHREASDKILGEDDDKDAEVLVSPEYRLHFELCYYLLDNICSAIECSGVEYKGDLKKLKKLLKCFRSEIDVDDHNEVPGNTISSIMRKMSKVITGKEQDFDESMLNGAIGKAEEIFTNPAIAELAPKIFEDFKPGEGQSVGDALRGTFDRLVPVIEKGMAFSNETPPEGVTIDGITSMMQDFVNPSRTEPEIEIIPKDKH